MQTPIGNGCARIVEIAAAKCELVNGSPSVAPIVTFSEPLLNRTASALRVYDETVKAVNRQMDRFISLLLSEFC